MIEPALTREDWKRELSSPESERDLWASRIDPRKTAGAPRHATAAIALFNMPFGFTRLDVDALREAAALVPVTRAVNYFLNALADRIEALLPPEDLTENS